MSFKEYSELKLADLCDLISRGITPSYTDDKNEGILVLNQKCIRDNTINLELARLTNPNKKKVAENKLINKYDILVNSTGVGTLGRVAQIKSLSTKMTVDSHVTIVRPKKEINPIFLGYNLFMNQRYIESLGEGSTGQTELSRIRLGESLKIIVPRLKEQESIAKILSDLDEKIETNNQINKKLEEMAQAIFKQWFVDFEFPNEDGEPHRSSGGEMVESEMGMIPNGWKVSKLSDIIYFNPRETLNKEDEYTFVEMASLDSSRSSIKYWEKRKLSGGSRFRNGDTLLARITPCLENGKTAYVDILEKNEVAFGSTEFIVMRETEASNKIYIYCLARENNFKEHAVKSMSGSSGRQRVQLDSLKSYKIAQAPKYIYDNFGEIGGSLFEKISSNNKEIARLIQLRDLLLPKLMSGEIRVPINN